MMEPLRISESSKYRGALADLAVELAAHSAGFSRSLPEGVITTLADLVRAMNCYYSNLIEGYDIHPIDIERALKNLVLGTLRFAQSTKINGLRVGWAKELCDVPNKVVFMDG